MKSVKLEIGAVHLQDGKYYYRYQLAGMRKSIPLKTANKEEAIRKAKLLVPTLRASTIDEVAAHVKTAKGLAGETKERRLALSAAWDEYSVHPDRATPATVSEALSYETTWTEFVAFAERKGIRFIDQLTPRLMEAYAGMLRTTGIAVDTHNRKIRRIRKVLGTLTAFGAKPEIARIRTLFRKEREERNIAARRLNFTPEQERAILAVFDDPSYRLKNKDEIRIVYLLGLYTGQRLKDCALLRWNRVDWDLRRLEIVQFKTGKAVSVPMAEPLEAALRECHRNAVPGGFVCPNVAARYQKVDSRGKNIGGGLVNLDVMRVLRQAGISTAEKVPGRKRAVTVYGFHSLRHTFVSRCAEMGIPKATVVSIIGDDASIIDSYYTHVGDDAQREAIRAVGGEIGVEAPRVRLAAAIEYIDACEAKTPELLEIRRILAGG